MFKKNLTYQNTSNSLKRKLNLQVNIRYF